MSTQATPAIDYDALAAQHGAIPQAAPIDYDALAAQHDAIGAPQGTPQVTMGPAQPDSLWDTIKKWTLHPFDAAAEKLSVSPSELTTNPLRARAQEVIQNAGQLTDVISKEAALLSAPSAVMGLGKAGMGALDAIDAYRASRAAKLAQDTSEWQKINDVLNVPKSGIRIAPNATSAASATTMPGRTIAQLGYSAKTLEAMDPIERMNLLDSHLQNAGQAISNAASAATNAGTTLDVGDSAMNVFKSIKDPAMQEKMIDQFNSTAKELGIANLRRATPEQALALRQALRAGKTFSGFSDIQTTANISKQLGGAVSGDLKDAVPDFNQLDQSYSDLRVARDAARGQVQMTLKQAPPLGTMQKGIRIFNKQILPRAITYGAGGALGYEGYRLLRGVNEP